MAAAQGPLPLPAFGGQGERARGRGAGPSGLSEISQRQADAWKRRRRWGAARLRRAEVRGTWLRRRGRSPYPPSAGRGSGRVAAAQESRTMRLE